jgi:hypothetical protein
VGLRLVLAERHVILPRSGVSGVVGGYHRPFQQGKHYPQQQTTATRPGTSHPTPTLRGARRTPPAKGSVPSSVGQSRNSTQDGQGQAARPWPLEADRPECSARLPDRGGNRPRTPPPHPHHRTHTPPPPSEEGPGTGAEPRRGPGQSPAGAAGTTNKAQRRLLSSVRLLADGLVCRGQVAHERGGGVLRGCGERLPPFRDAVRGSPSGGHANGHAL